jgi:dTDP-4-amino-4,6-dideoxygalactose transaminase
MTVTLLDKKQPAILGGAPMFVEGLPLVRPTLEDQPELMARLSAVLDSGVLTNGPSVRELEAKVAERLGVDHVIAVASCTSGLALTLQALEATGPVVMPSFTFAASAHAVVWARGTPKFADIRADDLTLDPGDAAAALAESASPATAMTATHVYGTPCRTAELQSAADRAGVPLVFDAAHGLGSVHHGRPVGSFGTAEVFSLSPTKVVVAGEGGLVATMNADLASAIRLGRDYGNPGDYDCLFPGLNARMSELHAVTALHSLSHLDDHLVRRHELARVFWDELADVPGLRGPALEAGDVSTYKDLTIVLDDACGLTAAELARALAAEGIDSRRYYSPPIHRQRAYRHLELRQLPVTDEMSDRVLSPPLWSHMSDDQMRRVTLAIRQILSQAPAVRAALDPAWGGDS